MPFIVRWPGRVKPGVSNALISQVDFLATFAALAGRSMESATSPDTQNVLPALLGDSPQGRAHLIEHAGGLAVRMGDWKFIPPRPGRQRTQNTAPPVAAARSRW